MDSSKDLPAKAESNHPPYDSLEAASSTFADKVCTEIAKEPLAISEHLRLLNDLKMEIAEAGANIEEGNKLARVEDRKEFLWSLAKYLPDFDTQGLYQKRTSLTSIAAAVLLGWLIGGLVSGLLNLLGMGGDILRVFAIFAVIWLNEYFCANPRARHILLSIFGLGALARFASMLAAGAVRFTGFGQFGRLVFGSARPNIFKAFWLMGGAFFLFLFFSKKITAIDLTTFKGELRKQIEQRMQLVCFVLKETGERDQEIRKCRRSMDGQAASPLCPKKNCVLANGVLEILDSLSPDKRKFLSEKLSRVGYVPNYEGTEDDIFVWEGARDFNLYNPVGVIKDGDRCRILKRPYEVGGKLIKGAAQSLADGEIN